MSSASIRPIGVYFLSGLAVVSAAVPRLFAIDTIRGYLVEINPKTNNTTVLNPYQVAEWIGAMGIAVSQDSSAQESTAQESTAQDSTVPDADITVWFTRGVSVFKAPLNLLDLDPTAADKMLEAASEESLLENSSVVELFVKLPDLADGIAVGDSRVYVSCQKSERIYVYDRQSGTLLDTLPQPGVGLENMTLAQDALWVCDRTEQTVYCLDATTGEIRYSALTPFESPTGIVFYPDADGQSTCYVSYASEEAYIRDDPNSEDPHQLTFRDRTFIHPLHIHHSAEQHYTLSNGYLTEISYVEELHPLEDVPILKNIEWRMALPADTPRQRVCSVKPIGHPFTEEIQEGQRVAVFRFDELTPYQAGLVGWKATVEMYGIKYALTPKDVEAAPALSEDFQQRYLVDDDELMMDTETVIAAAKEAVGSETNILRKALRIRNYVYDRLSYGIQPKIDTPDVALSRGVGSCGEYVGVLLALFRLNGIACRTIGRYKCPQKSELRHIPLQPDYNHVWLEFYIPGIGWLPMESNVDDVRDRGPYPNRFFMGLAWYHTELGKGISFGKLKADNRPERFSVSDLAINHIRFTILDELNPENDAAN
ncbi:MAG: transglutaminase domain-containing protein [Phormidesmis sp.]